MLGVFYRSDTRIPLLGEATSTDTSDDKKWEIFKSGFDKRGSYTTYPAPVMRSLGKGVAPDLDPDSGVCFTRHFQAAPIFPVGDLDCDSWVYVLEVDTTGIYNTQGKQWDYFTGKSTGSTSAKKANKMLWPMFGQERALDSVGADKIVGAVKVTRKFNGGDFMNGGLFTCVKYVANPGFSGTEKVASMAVDMIGKLVSSGKALQTPSCASGFVKSTKT